MRILQNALQAGRSGPAVRVAAVLALGLLAMTIVAGCPPKRTASQIRESLDTNTQRKEQIERELGEYGGEYDPATDRWHVDTITPMSPMGIRENVQGLIDEWRTCRDQIAQDQADLESRGAGTTAMDASHEAADAASRPPTTLPPAPPMGHHHPE